MTERVQAASRVTQTLRTRRRRRRAALQSGIAGARGWRLRTRGYRRNRWPGASPRRARSRRTARKRSRYCCIMTSPSSIPGRSRTISKTIFRIAPSLFGGEGGRAMARMTRRLGRHRHRRRHLSADHRRHPEKSRRGRCRLFPPVARGALRRQEPGRGRWRAATPASIAFRKSLEVMRQTLKTQPYLGGSRAELCRLHRVRRLPMGARGEPVQAAGGG